MQDVREGERAMSIQSLLYFALLILMVITFAQYWLSRAGQSDLD